MRSLLSLVVLGLFAALVPAVSQAQDEKKPVKKKVVEKKAAPVSKTMTVEELTDHVKPSVVVILHTGRDGKQAGLGTGFILSDDGMIATNLHVIGEGRPIKVQMPDGTRHDVTEVHASDRRFDLAIVKIDAKGLKALPVGDSEALKPGQSITAFGHPQGLKFSVVAGVLSGRREVDNIDMLQIAMPIEQGNSGGPVVDLMGRVVGVVTMKSLVTPNLGFAVPTVSLQRLLSKPNPIPMDQWITQGVLDKAEWKVLLGGRWRQRSGRIIADGQGSGFGGRSLCVSQRPVPKEPYELSVTVKLNDEAGAAGLIFGGDGNDRHYGFYPSGGKLRFTRFNGPDVFSWKILHDQPSEHYQPGDFNTLKVRIEKDRVRCYVNDHMVVDHANPDYAGTSVGLAKFRETIAEFKKFQIGDNLSQNSGAVKELTVLKKTIADLPMQIGQKDKVAEPFLKTPSASMTLLRERARALEKQADELRKLALQVHHQSVLKEFQRVVKLDDAKSDLVHGALLIAQLDNEELDVPAYRREVDRLAKEIQTKLPKDADADKKLEVLNDFLFKKRGFHGSRSDYYSKSNSYLNEVLDDREGLPITLAVLYLELGRKIGLNLVGVALPGHFVVRHEPAGGIAHLVDVYDGGRTMSDREAERKVAGATGRPLLNKDLKSVTKNTILVRMLHNLMTIAEQEHDRPALLRYLDAILVVDPSMHEERWIRAVMRFQAGENDGAIADCDVLLDSGSEDIDLERVRKLKEKAQDR